MPDVRLSSPSRPDRASVASLPPPPTDAPSHRAAIPPSAPPDERAAETAAKASASEIVESLHTLVDHVRPLKDAGHEGAFESIKRLARSVQARVARLGGIASTGAPGVRPREGDSLPRMSPNDRTTPLRRSKSGVGARPSISNSLDGYRPDQDIVAPISVRPNGMELLWICGDCGEHYPRARSCPERCDACGAPKQHFYAPIED
jgi:hypothetical protein